MLTLLVNIRNIDCFRALLQRVYSFRRQTGGIHYYVSGNTQLFHIVGYSEIGFFTFPR